MIIKIIPETEQEKKAYAAKGMDEAEHKGIREYMLFGNKIDEDGDLADFHEWHGSFRYLMGGLDFFYQTINDKRQAQHPEALSFPSKAASQPSMIKRGGIQGEIQPLDLSLLNLETQEDVDEDRTIEVDQDTMDVDELGRQAAELIEKEMKETQPSGGLRGLRILQ